LVERILALMEERGIIAAKLTSELGISKSKVTQWKQGLQKPSTDAVIKIANYFGVSTDYLLTGTNYQMNTTGEKERKTMDNNNKISFPKIQTPLAGINIFGKYQDLMKPISDVMKKFDEDFKSAFKPIKDINEELSNRIKSSFKEFVMLNQEIADSEKYKLYTKCLKAMEDFNTDWDNNENEDEQIKHLSNLADRLDESDHDVSTFHLRDQSIARERELLKLFNQLNEEGQRDSIKQLDTMVASDKYIKPDQHPIFGNSETQAI